MESYSEYSDYKDVNGIKYPFTRSRNMGPQVVELTVTDIKVNAKVKASEFAWEQIEYFVKTEKGYLLIQTALFVAYFINN